MQTAEMRIRGPEQRLAYHEPVMAGEVIERIRPSGSGLYLDGTVGGGGHARLLLERCGGCRIIAVDRDPQAIRAARAALASFGNRIRFVRARFDEALDTPDVAEPLSGALLDLGVSSHQLDVDERGFSFRRGVNLDMRMGVDAEDTPTAAQLLNQASTRDLTRIFRDYGEEPRARRMAREVIARRERSPFRTSDDLVAVCSKTVGRSPSAKEKARIFQAVRIAINGELAALERGLGKIRRALASEATLVVISYHSLEDRLVKNRFREWSSPCVCPPGMPLCTCRGEPLGTTLTRTPIGPSDIEVARNPRARSARLRAWRKT